MQREFFLLHNAKRARKNFFLKEVVVLSVRASAALFIKHKNSNIGAGGVP